MDDTANDDAMRLEHSELFLAVIPLRVLSQRNLAWITE